MVGKLIGGEASASAILASLGAEAGTGQVELVLAELAVLGVVLSAKAISQKIKEHKREKELQDSLEEQNRQQIAENEEYDRQADSRREQERSTVDQRNNEQLRQQSGVLESERQQRIQQLEREMDVTDEPDLYIEPRPGYNPNINYFNERFGPRPVPDPHDDPDNDPIGGGGNGGGGNDGGGNNPNPNPNPYGGGGGNNPNPNNNSRNKNPYDNMINWLQSMVNQQEQREKDRQKEEDDTKQAETQTAQQKLQTELQKETLDNQHIMQEQINAQLLALGESEKTSEEVLVELESIAKLIDDQIPDQVKMDPTSIFSSELISF